MYPQDPTQASDRHPINNPLSVMQPGETSICEIKRHPIGMLSIYVTTGFLLLALAIIAFIVLPNVLSNQSQGPAMAIGGVLFVIIAALSLGFVFVSNKVYWGNSWVVTSDSITQIIQTSLFKKRSSQLSLGNIEDVTAEQDGMLAEVLHYGSIRVETAGESDKFIFAYCPNPTYYAQKILSAREQFEQGRRGEANMQRPYRGQGAYQPAPAPNPDPSQDYTYDSPDPGINTGAEQQ